MSEDIKNSDYIRRTVRLHKIVDQKILDYQKEEVLSSWTDAALELLKKGLEKVKEEKKKW